MKKSYYVMAVLLGLLITTAAVNVATFAADANTSAQLPNRPGHNLGKPPAIIQAVRDGDYATWQQAMTEQVSAMRQHADELESAITQENFSKLQQVQQLIEDGDFEAARDLAEQLGLEQFGPPRFKAFHHGPGFGRQQDQSQDSQQSQQ